MFTETKLQRALGHLETLLPYTYAQFLAEDDERDYRVIAARIPGGGTGYAVAHRTGVIGQVFRGRRAIVVADTRNHPLYDSYDATVDWELAIPLFRDGALAGVLNVEGCGAMALPLETWNRLSRVVAEATNCAIPASPPDARAEVVVPTKRLSCANDRELMETARRLANEGRSVLVIGVPSASDDIETGGMPLAERVHGVDAGIDAVALEYAAFQRLGGWKLVDGRYDFVITKDDRG